MIYGLVDPRTGHVRYVGKTTKTLEARLAEHTRSAKRGTRRHRDTWHRQLLGEDLVPSITLLAESDDIDKDEVDWIVCMKWVFGDELTNHVEFCHSRSVVGRPPKGGFSKAWRDAHPEWEQARIAAVVAANKRRDHRTATRMMVECKCGCGTMLERTLNEIARGRLYANRSHYVGIREPQ